MEYVIEAVETFRLFAAIAAAIFIEAMPFLVIGAFFSAVIEVFVSEVFMKVGIM